MKKRGITILLPTLDEAKALRNVVNRIPFEEISADGWIVRIVVVDDTGAEAETCEGGIRHVRERGSACDCGGCGGGSGGGDCGGGGGCVRGHFHACAHMCVCVCMCMCAYLEVLAPMAYLPSRVRPACVQSQRGDLSMIAATPRSRYGLPVIGSCNYRAVITAVITCNYSPPFPVTCNLQLQSGGRPFPPNILVSRGD